MLHSLVELPATCLFSVHVSIICDGLCSAYCAVSDVSPFAQLRSEVLTPRGIFPDNDHAPHPIEWGGLIISFRVSRRVVLISTPISSGCECLCQFGGSSQKPSDICEGKRRKDWTRVTDGCPIWRKFWAGAQDSPTKMSRRRNLEPGRKRLVWGGGQLELSVNSASQGQVFLKETWAGPHPHPWPPNFTAQLWICNTLQKWSRFCSCAFFWLTLKSNVSHEFIYLYFF